MIVEFCKWGNSLAVRIPKALADAVKASVGRRAEIKVENGTLVLRPIVKSSRKSRYTLDDLLSGMTRVNVPEEIDWGPRRGNDGYCPDAGDIIWLDFYNRLLTNKLDGDRHSCSRRPLLIS